MSLHERSKDAEGLSISAAISSGEGDARSLFDDSLRVNRLNISACTLYIGVLYLLSVTSLLVGNTAAWYFIGFVAVTLPSFGLVYFRFLRNSADPKLKYFLSTAYVLTYFYIMILGDSAFRFALIFPTLCIMIMYHSADFITGLSLAVVAVNILNVCVCVFVFKRTDMESSTRYALQLITIVLSTLSAWVAARVYSVYFEKVQSQTQQLQMVTLQTIETIANTIDAKDSYTQGHSRRVAEYSVQIARHMGYQPQELADLQCIALLHDVGKIAVPDTVLNKPSRLTPEEYALMKIHTTAGGEILKDIDLIPNIALGAKYHHERYDGKGYPEGLKGEEIPPIARIICLADAYDAMTSNRVYRKHLPMEVVMEEIRRCRGTQFDPACVDAFLAYLSEEAAKKPDKAPQTAPAAKPKAAPAQKPLFSEGERDRLTGALNRTAGKKYLSDSLSAKTGALVLINIVGLKDINRAYGFRRGDHYLQCVAKSLRALSPSLFPVRYDGSEFLLFLPDLGDKAAAGAWMERFLDDLNQRSDAVHETHLGVSCAITFHTASAQTLSTHVSELKKALSSLKQEGGRAYTFYDSGQSERDELRQQQDLQDLIDIAKRSDGSASSEIMGEEDFLRTLAQLKASGQKDITLMLFTVKPTQVDTMPPESREQIMLLLEDAMLQAVGSRDFLSSYSSLQRIVMLCGKEGDYAQLEQNVDRIEKAILSNFYKMYDKGDVTISYSHCTISED